MTDHIRWLGEQVEKNAPPVAGVNGFVAVAGAVLSYRAAQHIADPTRIQAFGLSLPQGRSGELAELEADAARALQRWYREFGTEEQTQIKRALGDRAEALGFEKCEPNLGRPVLLRCSVQVERLQADEDVPTLCTPKELECFVGARPQGGDKLTELPCLMELPVGASRVELMRDEEGAGLVCDIETWPLEREFSTEERAMLARVVRTELWESNWAFNTSWSWDQLPEGWEDWSEAQILVDGDEPGPRPESGGSIMSTVRGWLGLTR